MVFENRNDREQNQLLNTFFPGLFCLRIEEFNKDWNNGTEI